MQLNTQPFNFASWLNSVERSKNNVNSVFEMKGNDLLKMGFLGLIIYRLLREGNQISNNTSSNLGQTPKFTGMGLTTEDFNDIIARVRANLTLTRPGLTSSLTQPKPSPDPQTIETGNWLRLLQHPFICLIVGGRGKGKSCLGYRMLEYLRWVATPWVVGLPKEARRYLPDWIGMAASLEDISPNSVVLVDEAYMPYHARSSMAAQAKAMSQLVNLSRQREQSLIFVSQEARQVDKNIVSSANVVVFKNLGVLQLKFDRRELNEIAAQAKQAFATLSGDKRGWACVYAPDSDFMGLMENSPPTFWTERLSHIFATGGEAIAKPPKKTPLEERIQKAKELKEQDLSNGQIAKMMGVSKATVKNYLEDYPYKK